MNKVFRSLLVLGLVVNCASFAQDPEGEKNGVPTEKTETVNPELLNKLSEEEKEKARLLAEIAAAIEGGKKVDVKEELEKRSEDNKVDLDKIEKVSE